MDCNAPLRWRRLAWVTYGNAYLQRRAPFGLWQGHGLFREAGHNYPKARSENREVWAVKKKYRGALAASELANWLVKAIGKPVSMPGKDAFDQVKGKTGIIFFENFWSRPGESSQDGDHIELWNGTTTPGMAASLYTTTPNYFTRSPTVWYWEIK